MQSLENWLKLSRAPRLGSSWLHDWDTGTDLLPWLLSGSIAAKTRAYLSQRHDFTATIAWNKAKNQNIICWDDDRYPAAFRQLVRPPILFYALGDINLLTSRRVAVVGARKASHFGAQYARGLAASLSEHGVVVVSGMALGIDAAAHLGALEYGPTVAVIGTGIDKIYPPQHVSLSAQIAANGLIISPFGLGAPPLPANFLQRNVLISALSEAVVVVEAAERSGSLSTARAALEQGVDVWAVPWSPGHKGGCGCLQLLQDGAGVLRNSADLLIALGFVEKNNIKSESCANAVSVQEALDPGLTLLLECINLEPSSIDVLCAQTGLRAPDCLRCLGVLEINGLIQAEGCGYVRS